MKGWFGGVVLLQKGKSTQHIRRGGKGTKENPHKRKGEQEKKGEEEDSERIQRGRGRGFRERGRGFREEEEEEEEDKQLTSSQRDFDPFGELRDGEGEDVVEVGAKGLSFSWRDGEDETCGRPKERRERKK